MDTKYKRKAPSPAPARPCYLCNLSCTADKSQGCFSNTGTDLMAVAIILLALLGCNCDHIINTEDRQGSLGGGAQGTDLGQSRLKDTSMDVIANLSLDQVKTVPLEALARLVGLGSVVVDTKGSNKVGRVLSSVDSQSLGDNQKGVGKLGNGQLLTRTLYKIDKE